MFELKGKKLLVLAGNDLHIKVVKAAKELGVYTIVTDYLPEESSPAKKIADEYWMISTSDVDTIVERCRKENVDGVIDYCIDTVQKHYQQICFRLGLPCIASSELFDIFTNKKSFKDYCKKYSVDVIPEYSENDIKKGLVKYPVLVKPSDSRGSRGITVCKSKTDLADALKLAKSESKDGCAIVERYMYGLQDMSVVYMVIGGNPYLVKFGDRYVGKVEDGLQFQQIATVLPSNRYESYKKNVEPNIIKMIKSTGIQFGVFFNQGFWEDNRLYLYDPGLRFPGSDFDVVTKNVTGFDSMKAFVEFAVTGNVNSCYGNPNNAFMYNGGKCLILSIACKSGRIKAIDGFDKIKLNPCVMSSRLLHDVGDEIQLTHDIRQRVAEFAGYFRDDNEIFKFITLAYKTLKILDENGNDMIISKLNSFR